MAVDFRALLSYEPPDFRPSPDYAPLLPKESARTWGLLVGASAIMDPLVALHETEPWPSTPMRDRSYVAYDFWRAWSKAVALGWPAPPLQERLFDPDDVNELVGQ